MPSDDVYMYLFGFQGDRPVNVHFRVNLGMSPLKSIVSEK